jgi:hypothetical protein
MLDSPEDVCAGQVGPNIQLLPYPLVTSTRRSSVTWGNGGPHSGSRYFADKDEVSVTDDDSAIRSRGWDEITSRGCRGCYEASGPACIKVPSGTSSAALGRLWAVDHRKPPDTSGHSCVGSPLVITGYSPFSVLTLSS